jgi:peptidoglycan pentaglycine glycine transferase (the first glycine)
MKFVADVEAARFDAFAIAHPLNHYSKTSPFIGLAAPEYQKGHLLGVEDEEGNLIASAVMVFKKTHVPAGWYAYCQYGFNLDIKDRELIRFFSRELQAYARRQGAYFLRMDFNITRRQHNKDGSLTPNGFNHEYVTSLLEETGFRHLGYNYGYSGNWMNRFTYRLDLDRPFAEILKGIKRCRIYETKNAERCVKVRPGTRSELVYLVDSEKLLSHKLGFKPKSVAWFEKLWDLYEPYVHYFIVSTNYHQAKLNLQAKIDANVRHMVQLKDEKKKAQFQKENDAMQREIHAIEDNGWDKDEEVVLGAKLQIMMGVNVWNVNMYTTKTLNNFRAAFALHRYALEELYKQGAKAYDFEGVSGSMDPKDEYFGITDFKKSFGGDFLEFLGEFDAVFDEKKYQLWWKSDHLYRRVRRKVRYLVYKSKDSGPA